MTTTRPQAAQGAEQAGIGKRVETYQQRGERLAEERERLSLTQQQLALETGVSLDHQINYELGTIGPGTDYLATLDAIGIDVPYVLTGRRTISETARDIARFLFDWAIDHPALARSLVERLRSDPNALTSAHSSGQRITITLLSDRVPLLARYRAAITALDGVERTSRCDEDLVAVAADCYMREVIRQAARANAKPVSLSPEGGR